MGGAERVAHGGVVRSVPGCRAYALLGGSALDSDPPPDPDDALSAVLSALLRVVGPP
ncbi:hypothetical protein [Micromonospora sp. NPDC048898]|uniref:hypothetical protein n=1 Tax=Micromonospora sp. NPDC048898 TaxID=3364260 RepID=UPI0037234B85